MKNRSASRTAEAPPRRILSSWSSMAGPPVPSMNSSRLAAATARSKTVSRSAPALRSDRRNQIREDCWALRRRGLPTSWKRVRCLASPPQLKRRYRHSQRDGHIRGLFVFQHVHSAHAVPAGTRPPWDGWARPPFSRVGGSHRSAGARHGRADVYEQRITRAHDEASSASDRSSTDLVDRAPLLTYVSQGRESERGPNTA